MLCGNNVFCFIHKCRFQLNKNIALRKQPTRLMFHDDIINTTDDD